MEIVIKSENADYDEYEDYENYYDPDLEIKQEIHEGIHESSEGFHPNSSIKEEINTAHIKQEQNSDLSYEDYYGYDDRVTTDNLPLSLSYPDISMNEEQGDLFRSIVNCFSIVPH